MVRSKIDREGPQGGVSGATGQGLAELLDMVYERLHVRAVNPGLVSHRRQAEALSRAITALDVGKEAAAEILAESVRQASHELASMVGRIGAEDYLDEIFSSFCIGK